MGIKCACYSKCRIENDSKSLFFYKYNWCLNFKYPRRHDYRPTLSLPHVNFYKLTLSHQVETRWEITKRGLDCFIDLFIDVTWHRKEDGLICLSVLLHQDENSGEKTRFCYPDLMLYNEGGSEVTVTYKQHCTQLQITRSWGLGAGS